jgi:beta-lactamase regulating signal transducer with metallopeptidase domain
MNDLGIGLVWLAVQVTIVALAGLGLTSLAARRAPAAGASAALTALAATALLAVLVCCPLPSWWAWDLSPPPAVAVAPGNVMTEHDGDAPAEWPNPAATSSPGGGLQLAGLLSALRNLGRRSARGAAADPSSQGWPAVVVALAATGTALGLLRLLLGLWAIRHSRQRSRPVAEPDLLRLVEELRAVLGVERPVAVREATDLRTAATVGWRRPVLLLPADWHGWTDGQRRAVVAHELAHIRRGDFAAWLLARLSAALHFWHPLVHVLAGRLQLQQELAADAAAAPLAGGRRAYLRALAELALRADGRAHGWPAPAFLSRKGTLLRRIEMLRVTDDRVPPGASRTRRRLTLALFLALTLTASALRGPVREAEAGPLGAAVKPAVEDVTPFDLALVEPGSDNKDVAGVFGVRPAAILKRPGMEPLLQLINDQIDAVTALLQPGGERIHVEDVEQLMGRISINGENQTGKRSLGMSLNVLRTTRDVDWVKLRDQCRPKMKQHHWRGETYVSFPMSELLMGLTGGRGDCYLWGADARTLVCASEEWIKGLIEWKAGGPKPAAPDYAAGWELVSRGLFAVALDNRGGRLLERTMTEAELKEALADPTTPEYHLARCYQNVSGVVAGCAGNDDFRFDLRASADTAEAATKLTRHGEGFLAAAKKRIDQEKASTETPDKAEAAALDFFRKVLEHAAVRSDGLVVTVHADAGSGFNRLLSIYAKELVDKKGGD